MPWIASHFDGDTTYTRSPPIREQFGIPEHAPVVGIAARMNPWKGQYELIGAISLLAKPFLTCT